MLKIRIIVWHVILSLLNLREYRFAFMLFHLMTATLVTRLHASTLINCLQAWGIFDALHVGVCDNGSNFAAGLRNSAFPTYLAWITHFNLLSMMAVYIAQPSVTSLTAKAISYRQSNLACKALHRIQEQLNRPVHKLIQDESTRWNTPYYARQASWTMTCRPLLLQMLN